MLTSSWNLKTRLVTAFFLSAIGLLVVGTVGYFAVAQIEVRYGQIAESSLPSIELLGEMSGAQKDAVIALSLLRGGASDPARVNEAESRVSAASERYFSAATSYLDLPPVDGEEALWKRLEAAYAPFMDRGKKIIEAAKSNRPVAPLMGSDFDAMGDGFITAVNQLKSFHSGKAKERRSQATQLGSRMNYLVLAVVVTGFLCAIGMGTVIASSLSRTLNHVAESLSEGANEVAAAASKISDSSAKLSDSASQQAASLQETAASTEQMSAMVRKNAESAQRSRGVAARSEETALRGKKVVERMVAAIEDIDRSNAAIVAQIEESNREISEIVRVIVEIGAKTKVINDIVFQTKLLSFNASVEAARAGEHGKGFAVVAEEVGNLAAMSGNASKEISEMLDGSVQKVEGIVQRTKESVAHLVGLGKEKVQAGLEVSRDCAEVLTQILGGVTEVNQMASEISTASEEQARGVTEITKAIGQFEQVMQQNVTSTQQASHAAEKLTSQVALLRSMVAELNRSVQGKEKLPQAAA